MKPEDSLLMDKIVEKLKSVYDPEIPVDIYELGLIYDVRINEKKVSSNKLSLELTNEELPIPTLNLDDNTSILGQYIKEEALSLEEIICICLALAPHISPHFLSSIISEFLPNGGEFPEFGGIKGKNHRGILPTAETVVYILAGSDIDRRLEIITSLQLTNSLLQSNVLYIEQVPNGEPKLSGKLLI